MPTRPDDNPNRIEDHYNQNDGRYGAARSLDAQERQASQVNPEDSSASNLEKLDNKESASTGSWGVNRDSFKSPSSSNGLGGPTKFAAFTKNLASKGKPGGIIALIISVGVIGTSSLSPALLMMHMKNVFLNDLSDSTPASSIRSQAMMRNKVKGTSAKFGVCSSAGSVRCKFSTMSSRQVKNFKKAGFEVHESSSWKNKIPGRTAVETMTYTPKDGGPPIEIKSPQDLKSFAKTTEGFSALNKAFNPLSDYFLNGNFSRMLGEKLGISKKAKVTGSDEKSVKESQNKATGAADAEGKEGGRFSDKLETVRSSNVSESFTKGLNLAGYACQSYNASRKINFAIKTTKIAAYASFAMTFLVLTDQILAQGDKDAPPVDPAVVSTVAGQLTSTDSRQKIKDDNGQMVDNPDYGKSPTDAQYYQTAAYGQSAHQKSSEKFSLGLSGGLAEFAKWLAFPIASFKKLPGGSTTAREACGPAGLAASILICVASVGTTCIASAVKGLIGGVVLSVVIDQVIDVLVKEFGPQLMLDAKTYGPDVGNAFFMGSAAILGSGMSATMGMMPASKDSLKNYIAYTEPVRQQQLAAKIYDAKSEPFNVYNEHSFLGSIVQPLNANLISQSSVTGKIGAFFNLFPTSLATIGRVSAAYNQGPQAYSDARYSACNDPDLEAIGVNGDVGCNVRYSMSSTELEMDPDQNVEWMISNGHIDEESGSPKGDDFSNFMKFCVDRKDPMGSTESGIEDSNDDWNTGKNCGAKSSINQSTLSHFRTYVMDSKTNDAFDQEPGADSSASSSADTTTPSYTNADGKCDTSKIPTNTEQSGACWSLKNNTDYSNIPCAPGSTDAGVKNNPANGVTVRSCLVKGTPVASIISQNVLSLVADAQKDGVNITLSSGLRTYQEQVSLYSQNCGSGACRVATAKPGTSNHEKGTAVDWGYNGKSFCYPAATCATGTNPGYDWFQKNANKYGFFKLSTEAWHWSTNGR